MTREAKRRLLLAHALQALATLVILLIAYFFAPHTTEMLVFHGLGGSYILWKFYRMYRLAARSS